MTKVPKKDDQNIEKSLYFYSRWEDNTRVKAVYVFLYYDLLSDGIIKESSVAFIVKSLTTKIEIISHPYRDNSTQLSNI